MANNETTDKLEPITINGSPIDEIDDIDTLRHHLAVTRRRKLAAEQRREELEQGLRDLEAREALLREWFNGDERGDLDG